MMSEFNISSRVKAEFHILDLHGELDAHTASSLEETLQNLIQEQRYNIVVNCSNLEYIASAGLGVFMAYIEDVRSLGGDIKLSNLKPKVFHVFDLLGFPALYDILDTEDEAISKFSN